MFRPDTQNPRNFRENKSFSRTACGRPQGGRLMWTGEGGQKPNFRVDVINGWPHGNNWANDIHWSSNRTLVVADDQMQSNYLWRHESIRSPDSIGSTRSWF